MSEQPILVLRHKNDAASAEGLFLLGVSGVAARFAQTASIAGVATTSRALMRCFRCQLLQHHIQQL